MQEQCRTISRLANDLAVIHEVAWRDHAAHTDEPLDVISTYRDGCICLEVVNYDTGTVIRHMHFA